MPIFILSFRVLLVNQKGQRERAKGQYKGTGFLSQKTSIDAADWFVCTHFCFWLVKFNYCVTLIIFVMLIFHSRSLVAPIYMMATILISYLSALGLSWFIFNNFFGYEGMSYRIPMYAFVFLVALGVDYNIMLISRIREEHRNFTIKEAVKRGVALTGGVISSAGLILAATFGVLMTQPILELFMFGFIVSLGILMDAFIVRGVLVPAIVTLLNRWNWWPSK